MTGLQLPSSRVYTEEADFLADAIKWLEAQRRNGIKVIRIGDRYHRGYSDLFICAHGRFIVAELKDDTGTASPHQEKFIEDIQNAGGVGGVCRSLRDIYDLIIKACEVM